MILKKYTFRTPLCGSIECEDLLSDTDERIELSPTQMASLYDYKGQELMMFLTDNSEDLTYCVPEELENIVLRAEFGDFALLGGQMWLLTYIYTKDNLTQEDYEPIQDWILGQMSDGWGEGLEQRAWMTDTVRKPTLYFDECSLEFCTDEEIHEVSYYVNTWNSNNFYIYVDHCEEVEEEEPKLDAQEALKQIQEITAKIVSIIDRIK